ncbi:MAG TPA: LytTR family DNA-binding domain-containing protein [Pyrinomonadaceae bacterium]|nr:LytTR family DNA-binding domain-containing protein [Pyrinomonadaceae bacterium]
MNRKICALVVDDETLAREALLVMLGGDPEIEVIAECRNGTEAVTVIREQSPDVVFLDIQMPGMDGFQVVEEVGAMRMPVTIFVTAYDKHALRAFEAHALDYLLKPFDYDRFNAALRRAKSFVRQQKLGELGESLFAALEDLKSKTGESPSDANNRRPERAAHQEPLDRVVIKSGGRIYFLKTEDIDWVEGAGDYLTLHSGSQTHLIRETMGNLHAKLDPQKFLRIHRSTIVNIERIKDIRPLYKGEYVITLTSGIGLKASRGYRHELQQLLDEAR